MKKISITVFTLLLFSLICYCQKDENVEIKSQTIKYQPNQAFYFQLLFDNQTYIFSEVTADLDEFDDPSRDTVAEGPGQNDFRYKLPKGGVKNLILKSGLMANNSGLYKWVNNTLMGNRVVSKDIAILLVSGGGVVLKKWNFHSAFPVAIRSVPPNNNIDKVMIESISFSYIYYERDLK